MTDADADTPAELEDTLADFEERANETTERIDELTDRLQVIRAELGVDDDAEPAIDVRMAPPSDLEAMLADAPDERDVRRLESRLSVLEEHMNHRGPDPCRCARCNRLRRLQNGEGTPARPFGGDRVTLTENGDTRTHEPD